MPAPDRREPRRADHITLVLGLDITLATQPWKETQIRLEDDAGRPVPGVEVRASVGGVIWARSETDAEGRCVIAMSPRVPVRLSARPPDARPTMTFLGVTADEPASITLPVLPPIRGRVLDQEGRPAPDVAVGLWIAFGPDGRGQMLPFPECGAVVTDSNGEFEIAPEVYGFTASDLTVSRRSKTKMLCFAAPDFRQIAYRTFDPTRAVEPMDVTLGRTRRVRIPIVLGTIATPQQASLSLRFSITPYSDIPNLQLRLINRLSTLQEQAEELVVEEGLPAGTYQLDVKVAVPNDFQWLGQARRELLVPEGEGPLELPPLELEPPAFRQMAGKPAPEIEATDLDTGRPVTLADFRGQVVILDFWGY